MKTGSPFFLFRFGYGVIKCFSFELSGTGAESRATSVTRDVQTSRKMLLIGKQA